MAFGRNGPRPAAAPRALGVLLGLAAVAGVGSAAAEGTEGTAGRFATGVVDGNATAGGRTAYGELLLREATARGVPPALAE
ncbi:MAG: lytic transglycosylase domain-containing protein, partial [Methylobacterium organophilum]|nr:lytic transglycosylase domain-containing protein [Methylobacterium organophilum]